MAQETGAACPVGSRLLYEAVEDVLQVALWIIPKPIRSFGFSEFFGRKSNLDSGILVYAASTLGSIDTL